MRQRYMGEIMRSGHREEAGTLAPIRHEEADGGEYGGGALTPAQQRYLAVETAIGAVINAVLSLAFVLLIFGRMTMVPVFGAGGLIVDAVPQTLMVSLMSMLVPGLLTRKRLREGKVAGAPPPGIVTIVARAVIVALVAMVVLTGLQFMILSLGPSAYPFGAVLVAKMLYGAILGALVARYGVRRLLTGQAR